MAPSTPTAPSLPNDPGIVVVHPLTAFSASVSWAAAADPSVAKYLIYVDGRLTGEQVPTVTTYYLTGLTPARNYNVSVGTLDLSGVEVGRSRTVVTTLPNNWLSKQLGSSDVLAYERPLRLETRSSAGNSIDVKAGLTGFPIATQGDSTDTGQTASVPDGHRVEIVNSSGVVIGSTRSNPDGSWDLGTNQPFSPGDVLTIRYRSE